MKKWLIIAALLIVVGCVAFVVTMASLDWDFTRLSTDKFVSNQHEISEFYNKINIVTDTADVIFVPSESAETTILCYEQEKVTHTVVVEKETLTVRVEDAREWYNHIGIHFNTPKITVYLPQGVYAALFVVTDTGDISVPEKLEFETLDVSTDTGNITLSASASQTMKAKTDTGNIRVENVSVGDIQLIASTGNAYITSIRCKDLSVRENTGNVHLKDVMATSQFSIETDTGNVKFDKCDAAEILVKTDTGDVTGSLLSEKIFHTKTATGKVSVPHTTSGGKCQIVTSTGDIKLEILAG